MYLSLSIKKIRVFNGFADSRLSSSHYINTANYAFTKEPISPCLFIEKACNALSAKKIIRICSPDKDQWQELARANQNCTQLVTNAAIIQCSSPSICFNLVIYHISTTPGKLQIKSNSKRLKMSTFKKSGVTSSKV